MPTDNAPDAVYSALLAAHAQAAQYPARTGAIINGGPMSATRNSGGLLGIHNLSPAHSIHLATGRTEGTEATHDAQHYGSFGARHDGFPRADR